MSSVFDAKKTMNIFTFCLCAFITLCSWGGVASAQVIEMPDANLQQAVRETLNLTNNTAITRQNIVSLTNLTAEERGIANLTGLEHATNLRVLRIPRNNISDLTPISKLTDLDYLGIWVNPISDLSPVSNLTNLLSMHAAACHISDITQLTNLTQLKWLTLGWQQESWITDISPLANLTSLVELRLSGNRVADISPLANLTQLEHLDLDSNRIVDISPLANLVQLKQVSLENNPITDFSLLDNLSALTDITRNEVCDLSGLSIEERIESRSMPSVVQPWGVGRPLVNLPNLPTEDTLSYHDLWWQYPPFGPRFELTPDGYQLIGNITEALARRDTLIAKNPNMIFLAEIRVRDAQPGFHYPEDWPHWLQDENGNRVPNAEAASTFLIDFRLPEVQDIIIEQVIAVSKCGLYDGIFIDWWNEGRVTLASPDWSIRYTTTEQELEIKTSMLMRIREQVPDDFLIISNNNRAKLPHSAPYMNGSFMETFRDRVNGHRKYTREGIIEIEDALIWLETNMREPQTNCLEGWGIPTEPPDSPDNRRLMRLFTTMSLTLSDGYVLYNVGWNRAIESFPGHDHYWYSFWDADLGQPISPIIQQYQSMEGVYIREFTNGWVVYNRSGQAQTITLPSLATSVSDRESTAASLTHLLPDLDGEIYLTSRSFADVNRDGAINVLDLVQIANGFGQSAPDPNGDGVVNILDLVFVAQQFSQ